jgi:hypothetical protein
MTIPITRSLSLRLLQSRRDKTRYAKGTVLSLRRWRMDGWVAFFGSNQNRRRLYINLSKTMP